ncbi:hypothetical protein GCM10008019_37000 [Deinococcus soli (ex Cha et al. 2016)]|nr:hypothetical protein GCM10008019_37000 [Deinococcus soli (ex Cha et al. 2016)]
MWWKRDFGYFPHLTILETRDFSYSDLIYDALKDYTIDYSCNGAQAKILANSNIGHELIDRLNIYIDSYRRYRYFRTLESKLYSHNTKEYAINIMEYLVEKGWAHRNT